MLCNIFGRKKHKVNLQAQKIKVSSNDVSTKSLGSISQQLPFWKIHMEPENDHLEKQTSISKFQPLVLHGVAWLVLHKEWGKETSNRSFPNRGGSFSTDSTSQQPSYCCPWYQRLNKTWTQEFWSAGSALQAREILLKMKIGSLGWWFGFLGSPSERDCYLRVSLESQTTNPNHQSTHH